MIKNELRKLMSKKRKALNKNTKSSLDKKIFTKIIENHAYINSNTIFAFVSYNSEVDTHEIILNALKQHKKVAVPKVISKEKGMLPIEIKSFNDLEIGTYGILEPKNNCKEIKPETIDFALIPGLAFDKKGYRLGYGGGYYDRFIKLMTTSSHKIGIAYDFQLINEIPMDLNDMKITGLITDKKILDFNTIL